MADSLLIMEWKSGTQRPNCKEQNSNILRFNQYFQKQRMSEALQKLKKILEEQNDSEKYQRFEKLFYELGGSKLKQDQISVLLRWSITKQVRNFHKFYTLLISAGADINFSDNKQKKNNLMIASESKQQQIVTILASDKKMNFLLEDACNKTALFYAINNKNKAAAEKNTTTLLRKCPQLIKSQRYNYLFEAINSSKPEVVRILLNFGANPDEADQKGNTPLHIVFKLLKNSKNKSSTNSNYQVMEHLIEKGANPYIKNKNNQNAFESVQKQAQQILNSYNQAKRNIMSRGTSVSGQVSENLQQIRKNAAPILIINNQVQREQVFDFAAKIYEQFQHLIEQQSPAILSAAEQDQSESEGFDDNPFQSSNIFVEDFSEQIHRFANQCRADYENTSKQVDQFIRFLKPICQQLNLKYTIYGSFASGLWINQCDIDVLLMPLSEQSNENMIKYLQYINNKLKGSPYEKSIMKPSKMLCIKIQTQDRNGVKKQKFDVLLLNKGNYQSTVLQHKDYVIQLIKIYPNIQSLFFVIRKLIQSYRSVDPSRRLKSYAIFLMCILFMQQHPHISSLGELVTGFLYKYAYLYEYEDYINGNMILNLPDPFSQKNNNWGKNTDCYLIQRIFKTGYLLLHTKGIRNRLDYLFDSKQLFANEPSAPTLYYYPNGSYEKISFVQ